MNKSESAQTNAPLKEPYPHEKRNLVVFALNQIVMRFGWMFKSESVVIPAFIDILHVVWYYPWIAPTHFTYRTELTPIPDCTTYHANAETTRVLYSFRVRFRHSVVCIGADIKPNGRGSKYCCPCFSYPMYPALARGGLQSLGEWNATRKTHQSREAG